MMEPNTPQISEKMTPKFFFLSLGVLVSLIASVTSFLNLAFATLDKKFPDALNAVYTYGYNTSDFNAMRSALATLIIFFPIFLILSKYWARMAHGTLGRIDMGIKKWMLYLVIFLSAVVIAVDLVTLVRYFVSGEITTRFILKVAIALLVALMVGLQYLFELTNRQKILGFKVGPWGVIKSSLLVIALIVFSFLVMGSPFKQRSLQLDDRRVQDLQNIQYQVINYYQQKQKLPEKMSDLSNPLSGYSIPIDPEIEKGKVYEYNVVDAKKFSFELCATFSEPIPKGWREYNNNGVVYPTRMMGAGETAPSGVATDMMYPYPGPNYGANDSWDHQSGRTCFTRTIDKDLYPPYPKPLGL